MKQRLQYLDGLRGVAIALVVLYHAYARWPQLARGPAWMAGGKMGVELFFLISGFVIFMSLEASPSAGYFLIRRWLRLFPAMLAASVFIFLTASPLPRPAGQPALRDLLPGLTFIDPSWWATILRSPQGVLEGSFWSLFVEAKFYAVSAMAFFVAGSKTTIALLIAGYVTSSIIAKLSGDGTPAHELAAFFDAYFWGWFAAGALHYRYAATGKPSLFYGALAISIIAACGEARGNVPAAICMALLFAAAQLNGRLQTILSCRPLVFLGFVSYPLYLLHENLMVGLATLLIEAGIPAPAAPLLPIVSIVALAWIIARWVEPSIRRVLKPRLEGSRP